MNKILVDVFLMDNSEFKCDIEYLLLCEVSKFDIGEMEPEVIKAIAVLKRSELVKFIKNSNYFDIGRHKPILDDKILGSLKDDVKANLKAAVDATKGVIAVSGDSAVDLFYNKSCSGGTANSEDILGYKVNYLRKVICRKCDAISINKILRINDYAEKINKKNSSWKNEISNVLKDVVRDETGRIISVSFLGKPMSGEEFMKFFSMPTNRVYFLEDSIEMRAVGEGLGLGVCLTGANNLASEGYKYEDIIKYYYTGVELKRLDEGAMASTLKGKKIILDPGHGGEDRGNIREKVVEKEVNFKISKHLYEMLKDIGCEVYLTISEDKNMPLSERVDFINRERPDFFISIHQNSFMLPGVNGVEAYCYDRDNESLGLGKIICEEISKRLGVKNRGVRFGDYYLLRECKVNGLLLECMYLSGSQDFEKYCEENYKAIGEAVFKSICRYYELEK